MIAKLATIADQMAEAAKNCPSLNGKVWEVTPGKINVVLRVVNADGTETRVCSVNHWSTHKNADGTKTDTWELGWADAPMNALINTWDGTTTHLTDTIEKSMHNIASGSYRGFGRRREP